MKHPKDGDTIVVWFSCGAASAIAAWLTLRCYAHRCRVIVVNNYVKQEDPDNRRFLADVERWLHIKIENSQSAKFPHGDCVEVWDQKRFMVGVKGAPCTKYLKKRARAEFEDRTPHEWMVMGFTSEEVGRFANFERTERSNVLPVLIEAGLTKRDCWQLLVNRGIELPQSYRQGYPNANCIGCVKATSPTYWNHVRKTHPHVFAQRAEQSRRLDCRLVRYKGQRIFLDELPFDAVGRPMKSLPDWDCSIFCEESLKNNP